MGVGVGVSVEGGPDLRDMALFLPAAGETPLAWAAQHRSLKFLLPALPSPPLP